MFPKQLISIAILILILSLSNSWAQSSLFNIPTTEVLAESTGYLELDADTHTAHFRNSGWQSYGVVSIYGLKKRVEIGLNGYLVRSSDGTGPAEFQPNVKYLVFQSETNGVAIATGAIAYIPSKGRPLHDSDVSVYLVGSKKISGEKGPNVTAGGYQLLGSRRDGGSRRGFLLGIEQPVFRNVSFIGDWNTGHNRFGYAATGFGVSLGKKSFLYSAYYFGNGGKGNNSLGVYYGYSF